MNAVYFVTSEDLVNITKIYNNNSHHFMSSWYRPGTIQNYYICNSFIPNIFFSAYYVPNTFLGAGDKTVNKTDQNFHSQKAFFPVWYKT